jgi:hypothetical protein
MLRWKLQMSHFRLPRKRRELMCGCGGRMCAQVLHSGDLICEGLIKIAPAPEPKKGEEKAAEAEEKPPAAQEAAEAAATSKEAVPDIATIPVRGWLFLSPACMPPRLPLAAHALSNTCV